MRGNPSRRHFLERCAALAALAGVPDLRSILAEKLPEPVRALLPGEALEAADIVSELLRLEQQAKAMRLPASPLDFHLGENVISSDLLYQVAMPRLVALIDRSERKAPLLADKAAALLARLHAGEHDTPDAWFSQTPAARPFVATPQGGARHLGELPVRPLRIAPEIAADEAAPVTPQIAVPALPDLPAMLPAVSTSLRFEAIAGEYDAWFAAAQLRPEFRESTEWHLAQMNQARPRYQRIGQRLGIPWPFIAVIHGLEASFNFRAHLHNGDFPLSQRTRQVPAGRPNVWLPPSDWESSAADALRLLGFTGQSDWSLPRMLYRLEAYNGFGYRRAGRASPYLWSFSTLYSRGKFVADGRFDPAARSKQCGGAVMLKLLDLHGGLG